MKDQTKAPDPFFKPHCLNLDADTVFLATQKLFRLTGNKRMLSSFVNRILEEFVLEDQEQETSVRQMARDLSERVRKEKFSQRKLIIDAEIQKAEMERKAAERVNLIEHETRAAVDRLGFKREWIRDRYGYNFSRRREELADAVSMACRLDLQWKDLAPIVTEIVLEAES